MNDVSVRRRVAVLAVLAAAVVLSACEDERVKQLDTGITRDSAVTVMAQDLRPGAGPDSFPNVYTRDRYLIQGKTLEVLYFTPNNEKAGKDSVPYHKLTPIVFVDYKLVAKGWAAWDSIAKANNIPVPDHSK